jgi:hypothetical protein
MILWSTEIQMTKPCVVLYFPRILVNHVYREAWLIIRPSGVCLASTQTTERDTSHVTRPANL